MVIALIKISSLIIAWHKFKSFGFRHTFLNKLVGFMLFVGSLFLRSRIVTVILCLAATVAAIDEVSINKKVEM